MPSSVSATMTVAVRGFAQLRDRLKQPACAVTLPVGATGQDLLRALREQHPDAAAWLAVSRLAVNCEFVSDEVLLRDGDEVALLPPVSGG